MANKDTEFRTYYGKESAGRIVFDTKEEVIAQVDKFLKIIEDVKKSEDIAPRAIIGLDEIAYKLNSLKLTDQSLDELNEKLNQYSKVPLGEDKFMHLSSFVGKTGESKVLKSEAHYVHEVHKMVKNTLSNLTNLILFKPGDEHLSAFFEELKEMGENWEYREIKPKMDHLTRSGIIKHYNEVKMEFLVKWLQPFEEKLGKKAALMSEKEVTAALAVVDSLKKKELGDFGINISNEEADYFRPFNKTMHELLNGERTDFWGYSEFRDEFVALVNNTINRFSFKLENHYLIFKTEDKTLAYLVGFSDDVFDNVKKLKENKLGITPHMKVFFLASDGLYKEVTRNEIDNSSKYYRLLKTAVVPYLGSLATILDQPLSEGFRDTFEMWI